MVEKYSNEIHHILNTFYRTTGIGVIYFDSRLKLLACQPSKTLVDEFICLGTNRLTSFLNEKFSLEPGSEPVFYTYSLNGNLVCNVVMADVGNEYIGAFVTQPVFIKKQSPSEIESLLHKLDPSLKDSEKLRSIIKKLPVRAFESITPLGETLHSLVTSVFENMKPSQILYGDLTNIPESESDELPDSQDRDLAENSPVRHVRFLLYLKIMDCIKSGDTKLMAEIVTELNSSTMPTHHLDHSDYMRSLKNSFIKVCMFACYSAIESNAPYYKTLDLADDLIRRAEKYENAYDIFELMKTSLMEFARAVEVSRLQSHSKPIRQVLDYIHAHYGEKITLETLAELTGLSTFYLSTIIKKETGLMLMDNINAIRVEESKKLLLNKSNNSVIDVAQQVGFIYQNHFSTVFKKFTGLTPTEFLKAKKNVPEEKDTGKHANKPAPVVVDQLRNTLSNYPEIYDAARIVDPKNHCAWIVNSSEDDILPETCYDFWKRGRSCPNCISALAFLNNQTYFKIDQKNDDIYLVAAIPKTIGIDIYIVEAIKKVSDEIIIDIDLQQLEAISAAACSKNLFASDISDTFYSRKEIDKFLPVYMRHSKMEKTPLSIILVMPDIFFKGLDLTDMDIQENISNQFLKTVASAISGNGNLAGQYMGDIVLIALNNTVYEDACLIAEKIEHEFEKIAFEVNGEKIFFTAGSGIVTLTDDLTDENAFVNRALVELEHNMKSNQTDS